MMMKTKAGTAADDIKKDHDDTKSVTSKPSIAWSVTSSSTTTNTNTVNNFITGNEAALILSTGAAYGNHYTTEQVLDALINQQKSQGNDDFDVDFATRVMNKCGFKYHSIALPLEDVFRRFTRSEYLHHRATNLVGLAERAASDALDRWGGRRDDITHLFWGTMTGGMDSPTIDIELTRRLGLSPDVERTSIEGMGCLTGFRLLNLAQQIVRGNPDARILVVEADLRSALGNSLPEKPTRSDIVSVCLFRDAASSVVVGGATNLGPQECPCYEVITGASRIVDGTRHLVDYVERDDGSIRLHLDRKLPDNIGLAEPDFVACLLDKGRKTLGKYGSQAEVLPPLQDIDICCHTGGPRVLQEVANSLQVPERNMKSSWEIMSQHGNLSGASNLAVLDHHNQRALCNGTDGKDTFEWSLCLSMGPGVCLEGLLLRDVRHTTTTSSSSSIPTTLSTVQTSFNIDGTEDSRKVVHIVGGGIAGATFASALDPKKYKVRIFEAASEVSEKGYGLAIWPSTMNILRDELGIEGLDLSIAPTMTVRTVDHKLQIKPSVQIQDKGFMKRSSLLQSILSKVEERHPGCISTGHKCLRVKFEEGRAWATYETSSSCDDFEENRLVSYPCDLLVGADGVNSTVRRYVALKEEKRTYGNMTAYRFLVPSPSKELLKETQNKWNMSLGDSIHSPCYHISNNDDSLNVVVLEYDGKPPTHPRKADLSELRDVAQRSNLSFIINLIESEDIVDLMCYSTFHVDCEPWYHPNAVIIGDAAHAYGPLTAKMANLAINDAHALATMLNHRRHDDDESGTSSQEQVLEEWQIVQRPKFDVTRIRTLRHLQLYSPRMRTITRFLWTNFPNFTRTYFGSIFAYDYEVYDGSSSTKLNEKCLVGVVGVKFADPLVGYMMQHVFKYNQLIICLLLPCIIACLYY